MNHALQFQLLKRPSRVWSALIFSVILAQFDFAARPTYAEDRWSGRRETVASRWLDRHDKVPFEAPGDVPEAHPAPKERRLLPIVDRPVTLSEMIQLSLTHSDVARVTSGNSVNVLAATVYDPEVRAALLDQTYTVFDPDLTLGYLGSQINEPPSSFFGPGIPQQTRRDEGDFTAAISKLWRTGAKTTVSYAPPLGYLFIPGSTSSGFNPIYSSAMVFEARQPLLRGGGIAVNQIPIRVAQLREEQSAWEFQEGLLAQVRSIEEAYWDLQAASTALQAANTMVSLAEEVVRIEEARFATEMGIRADVARAQSQLASLQQERIRFEVEAVNREFRLWNLVGCDPVESERLVPVDLPQQSPQPLDAQLAIETAVINRPDLVQRRLALSIREWEFRAAENGLQPQLDLLALYRANGVGQGLDDALAQASQFGYTDWTLGITLSMPIGNRGPKAAIRSAEWQLARERALLRENVRNISFGFAELARTIQAVWNQYQQAQKRVEVSQVWLQTARMRFTTPPPSVQTVDGFLLLLYDYQAALRGQMDAVVESSRLLAEYNGLLARWDESQGTLLAKWQLQVDKDPVQLVNRHQIPAYLPSSTQGIPQATNPAAPAGAATPSFPPPRQVDPVGDYRVPSSFDRSPFQGGWSSPSTQSSVPEPRQPVTEPSQSWSLPQQDYHQNSVRR